MARHRVSKVSKPSGARACESNGLPDCSGRTLVDSLSELGCAEVRAGHSSNDFETMGLPSYQHFLPSIRRQDQYPREFDGIVALHSCFACPVPTDESVAMQAANAISGVCFLIQYRMQWCMEGPNRTRPYRSLFSKSVRSGSKIGQKEFGTGTPKRASRRRTSRTNRPQTSARAPVRSAPSFRR
jgi:hypothetical protein